MKLRLQSKQLKIAARAKINWALDILGKRPDGYHELKMIMQPISLADELTLTQRLTDYAVSSDGSLPSGAGNLALAAWLLLKKHYHLPQKLGIYIKKNIPVAAGLGGGSADAAAVLLGANQMFGLGLDHRRLAELALPLGADIPFCLLGRAALARGKGEILEPLGPLPEQWLVLVNPGVPLSTALVYKNYAARKNGPQADFDALKEALMTGDAAKIAALSFNALEEPAQALCPQIGEIKRELRALGLHPMLSGSGPTVFAPARDRKAAALAAEALSGRWPFVKIAHTL
ncbi:MAG: 4-(cytidine 5'-diphospho)-2-C-methyl-D-erythritol kinase [Clostridiales bacterium]|nr:4-(cytidine 5'-diphospho)-2-C-methyl-D-erythritol kinase [Clostridiales bacterium]